MIRAKLRYTPTSTLTVDLGADYTRARENSAPNKLLAVANAPGITGVPFLANYNRFVAPTLGIVSPVGARVLDASYITADPFTTYATGPNYNDLDLYGFQATTRLDLGGAELKSITAYRNMHAAFARDGDNTPFVFRQTTNDDRQWQLSQELQLSDKLLSDRLSYVVGGFLFKEKASDIATADLAIGLAPPLAATPPFTPAAFIFNYTNNRSVAVYGQVDFALTPTLSFTAGGRYSKDFKDFRVRDVFQRNNVEYVNVRVKSSWSDFTPRLGINYKPMRNLLLYGSYAKGFKQGGFNGRPLVGPQEVTAYEPETLTTYEAGVKAATSDNALSANLAVFHSVYSNIQLTVNQTPTNFVANAARGRIDGFELELAARPLGWFSANASVGHTDARYTSVGEGLGPTQVLPITLDSKFVKTPRWTASGGGEISHAFADGSRGAVRVDATRYSRIYNDVANTPIVTEPGYTLVNARTSYRFLDQRIELAVFVTNLTDARYFASGNASGAFGLAEVAYGRPREWGASLGYRF